MVRLLVSLIFTSLSISAMMHLRPSDPSPIRTLDNSKDSVIKDSAPSRLSETLQLSPPPIEKKKSNSWPNKIFGFQYLKKAQRPPKAKVYTPEMLEMKRLQISRQDEINVLQGELGELSRLSTEAIKFVNWQLEHKTSRNRILKPDHFLSKIIKEHQKILQKFVKSRLSEILIPDYSTHLVKVAINKPEGTKDSDETIDLDRFRNLPNDLQDIITHKIKQKFGLPLVNGLKRALLENKDPHIDNTLGSYTIVARTFWTYIFKSWDFLIKYKALTPETTADFFKEPYLMQLLARYARIFAEDGRAHNGPVSYRESFHLTEHWHWKLSHGCLKNLDQLTKDNINGDFLLYHRWWAARNQMTEIPAALVNFVNVKQFEGLRWYDRYGPWCDRHGPLVGTTPKVTIESTELSQYLNGIIKLVASTPLQVLISDAQPQMRDVIVFYCDFLQHFNEHMEPGMLRKLLKEHDSESFDNRFEVIKISAEMISLNHRADDFYARRVQKTVGWETSSTLQSTFNDHLIQYDLLFKRLGLESKRICNSKYKDDTCNESEKLLEFLQKARVGIEQKSSTFSVSKN